MPSTLPVHAVARSVRFHHWKLGFKQSSFGHITRALHCVGFGVFVPTSAFPPCSCSVRLSPSGKADGPEVSLLTSPACGRDVTRRLHGAQFLAPGDPNEIAPCGESVSSPSLVLTSTWSSASILTEDLESHHLASVLSTHMGLPLQTGQGEPYAVVTRGLTGPVPCGSSILLASVCPFGPSKHETSSGHAVLPKEREPRHAPRSPPPHRTCRTRPYRAAYPSSYNGGTTWDLVGQVFSPFSPGDPTTHPVCPPWILVHPTEGSWSPNPSASDACGS